MSAYAEAAWTWHRDRHDRFRFGRGGPALLDQSAMVQIYALLARYEAEGEAAFEPRSRRPNTSPSVTAPGTVELITRLRKELAGQGLDAGSIWRSLFRGLQFLDLPRLAPRRAGGTSGNRWR